jgi:hypothetical protein
MPTRFQLQNVERDHVKDPGIEGKIILERILEKYGENV